MQEVNKKHSLDSSPEKVARYVKVERSDCPDQFYISC
jgi:hypothetical protein